MKREAEIILSKDKEELMQQFCGHGAKGFLDDDEFEVCENPTFKNYFMDESHPNLSAYLSDHKRPWLFKKMWKCYQHKTVPKLHAFTREFPYRHFSLTMVFYRWEDVRINRYELHDLKVNIWTSGPDMYKTISTEIAHCGSGFNELRKLYQWLLDNERLTLTNGNGSSEGT